MSTRTFTFPVQAPVTGFPSWYPSSAGQIVEIASGTTIGSSVRASGGASYPGTDPTDIVKAWSGGAIVYVSSQPYLVVMGGGHGDSYYNGIHKFGPLYGAGSNTPSWSVFLAPSPLGVQNNEPTYADGRMASIHTYNMLVGVSDRLYCVTLDDNDSSYRSDTYSFTPAGQSAHAARPSIGRYGAAVHYVGKIYHIGGNTGWDRLRIYDIASNTWTSEPSADMAFGNYVRMAVDTTRGAILLNGDSTGAGNGGFGAYWPNVNSLGTRRTQIAAAPSTTFSLEYDAQRDVFVSYVSGSSTVYETSAATLAAGSNATWTARAFSGGSPAASPPRGTYGRFRYVPELKGYIVAPNLESSVYFLRSA